MNLSVKHLSVKYLSIMLGLFLKLLISLSLYFNYTFAAEGKTQKSNNEKPLIDFEKKLENDKTIKFGKLENGLSYAVVKSELPKNSAYFRLQFKVGSINEDDEKRGYAHFLEHMAFNGSKNIPEGRLNKLLSEHGITFGAHSNAYTSFYETTYIFNLLSITEEAIDTVFFALDEIADDLLIKEDAVQNEKNVVKSELLFRKSPFAKNSEEVYKFLYDGTLLPKRFPIGKEETLDKVNSKKLREIYDNYYVPQNAFLIVTGDIEISEIEEKITSYFSDWKRKKEIIKRPDIGKVSLSPKKFNSADNIIKEDQINIFYDEKILPSLTFYNVLPYKKGKKNYKSLYKQNLNNIAKAIINNRINRLTNTENSPISDGSIASYKQVDIADIAYMNVDYTVENFEKALEVPITTVKKALLYGFTNQEVEEVINDIELSLNESLKSYPTRKGSSWASYLLKSWIDEKVILHPQDNLDHFNKTKHLYTKENIHKEFKKYWEEGSYKFHLATNDKELITKKELASKLNKIFSIEIENDLEEKKLVFYYDKINKNYRIKERSYDEKYDVTKVTFSNNVTLLVKPTKYRKNDIDLDIYVDGGLVSIPQNDAYKINLATFFNVGGLAKHDINDLERLMSGKKVSTYFDFGVESYNFSATTNQEDLLFQSQLFYAYLSDPGYFGNAKSSYVQNVKRINDLLDYHPYTVISLKRREILYGYDKRFVYPPLEQLLSVEMSDVKKMLDEPLKNNAIKITVVGDLDVEKTIDDIGKVFGQLGKRNKDFKEWKNGKKINFGKPGNYFFPHSGEQDQAAIFMAFKTEDYKDYIRSIYEDILVDILGERLVDVIREDLALTYSPNIYNFNSSVFDDFGYVGVSISSDKKDNELIISTLKKLFKDSHEKYFSEEEIERSKKRLLAKFQGGMQTNYYWSNILSEYPDKKALDIHENYEEYVNSVSKYRLKQIAKNIFDTDEYIVITSAKENNAED